MKLENALKTALEFEAGVWDIYREAMTKTSDEAGKHIFQVLCDEEQEHLDYLRECLAQWQKTGKIKVRKLSPPAAAREAIGRGLEELRKTVKPQRTKLNAELELLKKALEAEIRTSEFYREMAAKLDGEGQQLFHHFLEIEDGHVAIVQAEIDNVGNWGFWFDTPEFRLEAE
jgi:rubrerythrin